jgi:antitoxin Phd
MWTLQDAKNKFSEVVEAAMAGEVQEVTKRGKPAVVIMSVAEFARLNAAAQGEVQKPNFVEFLLSFPQGGPDTDEDIFPRIPMTLREIEF